MKRWLMFHQPLRHHRNQIAVHQCETGTDHDFAFTFNLTVSQSWSVPVYAQLARVGAGIARIGEFTVSEDLQRGDLVPLLEEWNPGDREPIHAVFVGGAAMPARVRLFVDFLVGQHRM